MVRIAAKNGRMESDRMKGKTWKSWKKRAAFALKTALAAGLILFLFMSGRLDFGMVADACGRPLLLTAGALFCSLAIITPIFRWWILTRVQKLPLGVFDALRLTMIGYFFNMFIPSGSGGDVVRAAYAVRDSPGRGAHALTIALVDRGLGLHALLLTGASLVFIQPALFIDFPGLGSWLFLLVGLLVIGTAAPVLLLWRRTNDFVIRLCGRVIGGAPAWREAMALYRRQPGMIFLAYLFSLGSALFNVLTIHFMMLAAGSGPTLMESLFIAPLVILANTLPFTPGGIGVAEGASAGLYGLVGCAGGANGMLLTRLFIIFHALMGAPFFLMNKRTDPDARSNDSRGKW